MRITLCLALAFALAPSSVNAAPIGVTKAVSDTVNGTSPGNQRKIVVNGQIFENDRLVANQSGNAQIELLDGTKLVVGPGASLTVDEFAYSGGAAARTVLIKATKGAFRFISGRSGSAAYRIATPSATIGVRGTAFDVTVASGGTYVALMRGAVNVCDRAGACKNVTDVCSYVFVGGGGGFSPQRSVLDRPRLGSREVFPLLVNQGSLLSEFRRSTSSCGPTVNDRTPQQAAISPPAPPAPAPPAPGNPGNNKGVGNAGETPNGGQFGGGAQGRGDVGNGNGNGNGNGKGNGRG